MKDLDLYYQKQPEPNRSCLQALQEIILGYDPRISETWKYQTPFFLFDKKMLCYLSVDRRTQQPYIGWVEGRSLNHPALKSEGRKRIKVFKVSSDQDIPIEALKQILAQAIALYEI